MPKDSSNRGLLIVLAYLWLLVIVPLPHRKNDPEVRWHARHGLLLMAAELVASACCPVTIGLMHSSTFGVGIVLSLCFVLAWIATGPAPDGHRQRTER